MKNVDNLLRENAERTAPRSICEIVDCLYTARWQMSVWLHKNDESWLLKVCAIHREQSSFSADAGGYHVSFGEL